LLPPSDNVKTSSTAGTGGSPVAAQATRSNWALWVDVYQHIYSTALLKYFEQPPAAQTMFVTPFLGALGALSLNVLRMSKVGAWSDERDPRWGELLASPFLGALAAFGIFLIGSAGLLLTSDVRTGQDSVAPLAASFIGLLGFVSGLLYDQAFGRVRRFGSQIFAADPRLRRTSEDDVSLANALKIAGASLAAQQVLTFGIGTRLAGEAEFTLLVPADPALEALSLQRWRKISDPATRSEFENWFRHYHATKRVMSGDVVGTPNGTISEIQVDDGTTYSTRVEEGDLKLNSVKAIKQDIPWANGVIHIVEEQL
jgi:hypothetical protein